MDTDLPKGISRILKLVAEDCRASGNVLDWVMIAKLKGDLNNRRGRWRGVSVDAIAERCRELGMREKDIAGVTDLVEKAQKGRRLVPQSGYRDFYFTVPLDQPPRPSRTGDDRSKAPKWLVIGVKNWPLYGERALLDEDLPRVPTMAWLRLEIRSHYCHP